MTNSSKVIDDYILADVVFGTMAKSIAGEIYGFFIGGGEELELLIEIKNSN